MSQVEIPPDRVQDPYEKNVPGLGLGRDGVRTPMQWDAGPFAGFSTCEPWLPLAPDYTEVNVQAGMADPDSMLSLHRRLLSLRRLHPALASGRYVAVPGEGDLLMYRREAGDERLLVALNFGGEPLLVAMPEVEGRLLLSTFCDREEEIVAGEVSLRANEGVVIRLA